MLVGKSERKRVVRNSPSLCTRHDGILFWTVNVCGLVFNPVHWMCRDEAVSTKGEVERASPWLRAILSPIDHGIASAPEVFPGPV